MHSDPATTPKRRPRRLKAGLHYCVDIDRYVRDPAPKPSLSTGTLRDLVYRSPAHAWWTHPRLNPAWSQDDSSRGDLGSAVHSAILGGKGLVYGADEWQDWRTKEARDFRDAQREAGRIALLSSDRPRIESASKSAIALLETLAPRQEWQTEGTMIWQSEGCWKRGRFDAWCRAAFTILDVKTCTSANPSAWIKTALTQGGYDIQAEHYLEGLRATGAVGADDTGTQFLFLLVEIEPPFACSLVGLDPGFSEFARRKIALAADLWKRCIETNTWPGYSVAPHWAELSPWQEADLEVRMAYMKEVAA